MTYNAAGLRHPTAPWLSYLNVPSLEPEEETSSLDSTPPSCEPDGPKDSLAWNPPSCEAEREKSSLEGVDNPFKFVSGLTLLENRPIRVIEPNENLPNMTIPAKKLTVLIKRNLYSI